jgi:hypothetical protein
MSLGKLAVEITPDYESAGDYIHSDGDNHRIVIRTQLANGAIKSPRRVQSTAQHELRHFSDKVSGNLEETAFEKITYGAAQQVLLDSNRATTFTAVGGAFTLNDIAPTALSMLHPRGGIAEAMAYFPVDHPEIYDIANKGIMAATAVLG